MVSVGATMLLLGGLLGTAVVWRSARVQMEDAEFLQMQLERVKLAGGQAGGASPQGPEAALVRVGVAERKTIRPRRPIIGRLVEVRKVTVASEVVGKIVDLPVEEGTPVIGGETVFARVDDVWGRLTVKRCRAQVAAAKAKLKYEALELKRHEELTGKGAASQSELESRQAAVRELKASRREAKAAVEEGSERIARSVLVAPFDGTVVAKHVELGGHVSQGTPIVDIVSRGQVDARLMVPESVINLIDVGQTMPVEIDPLGEEFDGEVVSVTPYGPTASRTFPVRVRLGDQGGRFKVGMSVTAMVDTGPEQEALVVSRDAVLIRPGGSTVWVAQARRGEDAAEVQPVPVTIRVRMPEEYAVEPETDRGRKLLGPGAHVVVEGAERLMPGQQVRIVTLEDDQGEVAGTDYTARQSDAAEPRAAVSGPPGRQES